MTNSDFSCLETLFFTGSRHCVAVLQTQVPKLCIDLDLSLFYILILGTYSKIARKNFFSQRSAFAFCSLAWVLAACLPCQDHVYSTTDESFRFHNKKFDKMRCKLDSTENPRSFEKYPTPPLRVDLNPSKTKSKKSQVRNVRVDFRTIFPIWYKISVWFVFRTCFAPAFYVRPRRTCDSSRRSARR